MTVTGGRKNAGSYTARAARLSNGNYTLPDSATRAYTIKPRTVGLKWTGTSLTYNGKVRRPTATATGLIAGDKCKVTVTGGRKNAGSYTAKATKLSNANYALPKARTKACAIKKRTITLKWTDTRLKYNGKAREPTATALGLIKGDVCKVTVSGARTKKGQLYRQGHQALQQQLPPAREGNGEVQYLLTDGETTRSRTSSDPLRGSPPSQGNDLAGESGTVQSVQTS